MCLFHTTVSTFTYFTFMSFQKPAKVFCSAFRCITTTNNKQILNVIIEIYTKISDVLVFISNQMT